MNSAKWIPFIIRNKKMPCQGCGRIDYILPYPNYEMYVVCDADCHYRVRMKKLESSLNHPKEN